MWTRFQVWRVRRRARIVSNYTGSRVIPAMYKGVNVGDFCVGHPYRR